MRIIVPIGTFQGIEVVWIELLLGNTLLKILNVIDLLSSYLHSFTKYINLTNHLSSFSDDFLFASEFLDGVPDSSEPSCSCSCSCSCLAFARDSTFDLRISMPPCQPTQVFRSQCGPRERRMAICQPIHAIESPAAARQPFSRKTLLPTDVPITCPRKIEMIITEFILARAGGSTAKTAVESETCWS